MAGTGDTWWPVGLGQRQPHHLPVLCIWFIAVFQGTMLGTEEALPFEEEMDEWVNERIQTVKRKRKKRCCLSGPGDLTR